MTGGLFIRGVLLYLGATLLEPFFEAVPAPRAVMVLACLSYLVAAVVYLGKYLFQHRDEIEGRAARR